MPELAIKTNSSIINLFNDLTIKLVEESLVDEMDITAFTILVCSLKNEEISIQFVDSSSKKRHLLSLKDFDSVFYK